jgi:hypothetical protein
MRMEHSFIEKNDLIDRYVRGTMPPAERSEFEEHFLDCPECLEQLDLARSFREGIKVVAAQAAVVPMAEPRPSRSRWFSWRPAAALAAAVLLVSTIPSVVLYRSLEQERHRADELANAPVLPPAVYTLSQTRGVQVARTIKIPVPGRWILLSLEVDASGYHDYRAVLHDSVGQAVWTSGSLEAAAPDSVGVALPSQILRPGEFVLALEGRAENGGYVSVANFPLHAVSAAR